MHFVDNDNNGLYTRIMDLHVHPELHRSALTVLEEIPCSFNFNPLIGEFFELILLDSPWEKERLDPVNKELVEQYTYFGRTLATQIN